MADPTAAADPGPDSVCKAPRASARRDSDAPNEDKLVVLTWSLPPGAQASGARGTGGQVTAHEFVEALCAPCMPGKKMLASRVVPASAGDASPSSVLAAPVGVPFGSAAAPFHLPLDLRPQVKADGQLEQDPLIAHCGTTRRRLLLGFAGLRRVCAFIVQSRRMPQLVSSCRWRVTACPTVVIRMASLRAINPRGASTHLSSKMVVRQ